MRRILTRLVLVCLLIAAVVPVLAQNADRDGDGMADDADQCPDLYAEDGGIENSGCPQGPDFDSDNDGVIDSLDVCPTLPAEDGGQDGTGCPPEVFAEPLPAGGAMETTLTPTPAILSPIMPLATPTDSPYGPYYKGTPPCEGSLAPRLAIGDSGQIVARYSSLRTFPAGPVIHVVYKPATFTVVDGPICAGYGPLTWYYIRYDDPALGEGWASESQVYSIYGRDQYWLEPAVTLTPTVMPSPSATPTVAS